MANDNYVDVYDWIRCPECGCEDVEVEFESMLGEPPRYTVQCESCGEYDAGSTHYGLP